MISVTVIIPHSTQTLTILKTVKVKFDKKMYTHCQVFFVRFNRATVRQSCCSSILCPSVRFSRSCLVLTGRGRTNQTPSAESELLLSVVKRFTGSLLYSCTQIG